MVGRANLNDPSLFRSEPPAALMQGAKDEWAADEETTIEFVGSLADPNRDEAPTAVLLASGHMRLSGAGALRAPS